MVVTNNNTDASIIIVGNEVARILYSFYLFSIDAAIISFGRFGLHSRVDDTSLI